MYQHLKYSHRELWDRELAQEFRPKMEGSVSSGGVAPMSTASRYQHSLARWIVMTSQSVAMCEDKNFRCCYVLEKQSDTSRCVDISDLCVNALNPKLNTLEWKSLRIS